MHPRASEAFIANKGKKVTLTVLDKLARDTRQAVKIAVANNPNTSIETLETIIRADKYNSKPSLVALKHLLERAPTRAEKHLLHYYEQMHYMELSCFILQHPAAPIDLLKSKLRLLSWMERYTITQNPKTSREILDTLAKDANRVVRAAAKERLENIVVTHNF
jgi:hypothetical protein